MVSLNLYYAEVGASDPHFSIILNFELFGLSRIEKEERQAGAELCQAHFKLGLTKLVGQQCN